jgi:hypothetical protein
MIMPHSAFAIITFKDETMITYIKVPDEIYLKWLDFNEKQGTASKGRYAGIGEVNAKIFISAIEKIMKEMEETT